MNIKNLLKKAMISTMLLFGLSISVCAQQPQTSTAPLQDMNVRTVQGVGTGYWPTKGSGLVLNIAPGTVICVLVPTTYSGGTLTMANNTTNYIYLDLLASCVPATKTTPFVVGDIPQAQVTTAGGVITNIFDIRGAPASVSSGFNPASPGAIGGSVPNAATFTTLHTTGAFTSNILGSIQCVHVNTLGVLSGTGSDCGVGGGSSVFPMTVSGTVNSGGIPCFTSSTTEGSSALLPAGDFVLGSGVGACPTASFSIVPVSAGGTGGSTKDTAVTALLPVPTRPGDTIYWDGSVWNHLAGNNSGTRCFEENPSGVPSWQLCQSTAYPLTISGGTSGGIPCFTSTTSQSSSGLLPAGQFLLGGGVGVCPTAASLSGDVSASNSAVVTVTGINGVNFGGLATGIIKNTTVTGTPSIAIAADFPILNQNTTGTAANLSGTPALPNGTTATTQSLGDSSSRLATDAFVIANAVAGTNPMTTLGDITYGGVSGVPTRLAGPTGPNGVGFYLCSIPSGGLATAENWCWSGVSIDAQTSGSPYVVPVTERSGILKITNSSAYAVTLPSAASTNYQNGFNFGLLNTGTGLVTITPTTSTFNGSATQIVPSHWGTFAYSDNTNYFGLTVPDIAAFTDCQDTTGKHINFTASTGTFTCGTSGNFSGSVGLHQVALGGTSGVFTSTSNFTYDPATSIFNVSGPGAEQIILSTVSSQPVIRLQTSAAQMLQLSQCTSCVGVNIVLPTSNTFVLGNGVNVGATDPGTWVYTAATGYTKWNGTSTGSASIGVAAAAGTPCTILLPITSPLSGDVLSSAAPSGGACQTSWIAGSSIPTFDQILDPVLDKTFTFSTAGGLTLNCPGDGMGSGVTCFSINNPAPSPGASTMGFNMLITPAAGFSGKGISIGVNGNATSFSTALQLNVNGGAAGLDRALQIDSGEVYSNGSSGVLGDFYMSNGIGDTPPSWTTLSGDVTAASGVTTVGAIGGTSAATVKTRSFGTTFGDTTGLALTAGSIVYMTVPYACTIAGWDISVDAGTATIDIWKIATGGTANPTVSNTITASALPAISTGTLKRSTTLTGWTTAVAALDTFAFKLQAVATAKFVEIDVTCTQ